MTLATVFHKIRAPGTVKTKRLILAAAILALVGCSGRDFARPTPDSLSLGHTTRGEVEAIYGKADRYTAGVTTAGFGRPDKPKARLDSAAVDGSFASLFYHYIVAAPALIGGNPAVRAIGFEFWNDRLVGYNFLSSFAEDSSDFDEIKIAGLLKGKTTRAEIVQRLGPPTGRARYPLIRELGDEKLIYSYTAFDQGAARQISKRLEILLDKADVVQDFRFVGDANSLPFRPGPASYPIIIPGGR